MDIRKDQSQLTSDEREIFIDSLLKLKNEGNPVTGRNYDTYVKWHMDHAMTAHRQPQFLPWHRIFVRLLELDLKDISGGECPPIPYWDWTLNQGTDDPLWSEEFLGGSGDPGQNYQVTTGPFALAAGNWPIVFSSSGTAFLQRRFAHYTCDLPSAREVTQCLGLDTYDVAPWSQQSDIHRSFRNRLEGWCCRSQLHNRVHVWVGGSMLEMTSPNDPVFFLHHCNVDRIWAAWQEMHPTSEYQTGAAAGLDEEIRPFTKSDGVDYLARDTINWKSMGFDYDNLPTLAPPALLGEPEKDEATRFFEW